MLTDTTRQAPSILLTRDAPTRRLRFIAPVLVAVAAFAAVVALIAGAALVYGWQHGSTTFRGVQAAGVDLGNLSLDETTQRLQSVVGTSAPKQITLVAGDRRVDVSAEELGVHYDLAATAERAYDYGRTGNLWYDTRAWLESMVTGHEVSLAVTLDDAAVRAALERIAPSATTPPRDAQYVLADDNQLRVEPGADGVGIDVSETMRDIQARMTSLSSAPVAVTTVKVPPAVDAELLQSELDRAQSVVSQPLILDAAGAKWSIAPESLRSMLIVADESGDDPHLTLRQDALTASIASLTDQVATPGQDAKVVWDGQKFTVQPSTAGHTLDVQATVAEVNHALDSGQHEVQMKLRSAPAAVGDSQAQDAASRAQALVEQPLKLSWSGGSLDLAAGDVAPLLRFQPDASQPGTLQITVNQDALTALLNDTVAPKVAVAAKNADLRYLDGQVKVVSPEKAGVALNVEQSADALKAAVLDGTHAATLATKPVDPQVTAAMAGTISINDRLASASTSYAGSVANRKWNVELAVERANGALIPPGGVFSFVGAVGAIDTNSGYKVGYGIVGASNGSVSTVPSVGGGVCQVSTTAFQTAFWAGMPIVERNWHLYWIPLYGQPPSGVTGLDATVDTDAGLDMKFKNTTDHWLALVGSADGTTVHFELWGTKPNWDVKVDDPVVTNRVEADTTMQYEKTDQLAPGTSVLVEHAEDGFDVDVHRQVIQDGKVIDDLHLKSSYRPSANVTLVGE